MWYKVLIPTPLLIIPVLVMTTKCHTPKYDPNVIVINSKHAELEQLKTITHETEHLEEEKFEITTKLVEITRATTIKEAEEIAPSSNEDIVFIPNEKEVPKKKTVEEYWKEEHEESDKMTLHDLMNREEKLSDIVNPKNIKIETEKPNEDIIFITGKNDENIDKPEKNTEKQKNRENASYKKHPNAKKTQRKLNCTHLDCNNNISSVCGGKLENREWKYRLFLNECYFRKVNCYFRKRENRYQELPLQKCQGIAVHGSEPFEIPTYQPKHLRPEDSGISDLLETRRIAARRTLTRNIDGQFCSHACPTSCPSHYEPECAVSESGQIRVFMNHCKMDWNSCSYGIVWHRRPLADCVGGKKADMRQNSGFINWMQSVGIVDNKGRLMLN